MDADGWRYPQDCRIHRRRQTAGLAQRVDVLHSPRLHSWLCSRWPEEGSRGRPALARLAGFPWAGRGLTVFGSSRLEAGACFGADDAVRCGAMRNLPSDQCFISAISAPRSRILPHPGTLVLLLWAVAARLARALLPFLISRFVSRFVSSLLPSVCQGQRSPIKPSLHHSAWNTPSLQLLRVPAGHPHCPTAFLSLAPLWC
ncbi:hypothetical protein J3F83DRAFT_361472 [Trichoderma novae-zelandiae]